MYIKYNDDNNNKEFSQNLKKKVLQPHCEIRDVLD